MGYGGPPGSTDGDTLDGVITLPARHLPLDGTRNVRDVGGYGTTDGRRTRWRTLLRSDELTRLPDHARLELEELGVRQVIDLRWPQELVRAPNEDGLLFPTRTGLLFDRHHFMGRAFKPAARAMGIPELTFHDLRHTGASLMIAARCHVKVIAEQMGHSDGGALVLRRYGHLYKGARKQAALALEAHVLGDSTATGAGGG